ncbi:MAG: tetrahydromethanopterin S-methyltransferase subunit A [Candidatus Thorarchaeota archaeon]|jgi:tetrahydromethanopterin S-methyltransferase subunit A
MSPEHEWPPVPGDFEVRDPSNCVAICTLGKKIEVDTDYAIIGTCKTENIGIERVIINVISNPKIRFLILAGPEVPGHLTGRSLSALYHNGVDRDTRKIVDAEGAIPYIENVPLEGIDQFREQIELIEMINKNNPTDIASKAAELISKDPGEFSGGALWVEFKAPAKSTRKPSMSGNVMLLPEYGVILDSSSSLITGQLKHATVSENPSSTIIEVQDEETGTILFAREG